MEVEQVNPGPGVRPVRSAGPATLVLVGVLLVLLTGCTGAGSSGASQPDNPGGVVVQRAADPNGFVGGTSLPQPYALPDRVFTDTAKQSFNLAHSPSTKVTLVFFGYTNCPDVCGTVLAAVAQALSRSEPEVRQQIQMVFITTDPARDDPATIRAYLDRFDPSFIGLTTDLTETKDVAARLGVDVSKSQKLPSGGYEVGHSTQVIGFDAHRRGVVMWTPGVSIADLKADFARLVEMS